MTIVPVDERNIKDAALVHSRSWTESHRDVCTEEFLKSHTPERQEAWILSEMKKGSDFYMLSDPEPKGIISVKGSIIAHVYVIPEAQNKGYGTVLLNYAETKCSGTPTLWVRSTNTGAIRLYERNGFVFTGQRHMMHEGIMFVEEMRLPDVEEESLEMEKQEE